MKKRIADILPTRREDAVSYKQLSIWTGLTKRQLRELIRRERRKGYPILSSREKDCSGVWLWDGKDTHELDRCCETLFRAGFDLWETARIMKEHNTPSTNRFDSYITSGTDWDSAFDEVLATMNEV